MHYQIQITHTAERDLIEIYNYIAFQVLEDSHARTQLSNIEQAIYSLEAYPERYPLLEIKDFATLGVRKLPVGNYLIFYQIRNKIVFVLRILYARRDWLTLL